MKKTEKDYSHINGWGIDQNPLDVPAYPMKHRTENDNKGMIWERPTQQPATVEILHSNERPGLTAVFGTPVPPSGISGNIRRFAFKYSESHALHWLALLLADRVQMFEGLADDLKSGHVPNIYSEVGGRAALKHNPAGVVRKVVISVAVVTLVVAWLRRK
ncbi:hypothetical protein L0657_22135 [Dyadobacter sp. CY345]|uniref:hypothetical protein n=1 Tax=Dyadobacter sp. CY345 TaxID=2909335 RepID=UPI001F445108|nr:hypothetical protein [Dyadobacter sp. CY345]MCF2446673.1 hypothetical protein [Dyadobacter sp. CY345]